MIVSSGIEIAAPAETVWRILLDLPRYAEWNPFIRRAWGSMQLGGTVHVRVRGPWHLRLGFAATIVERDELRELRWRGTFGGRRLGYGDHRFVIEPLAPGGQRVRFTQLEEFGGLIPRLVRARFAREVRAGFDAMNRALAERAERASDAARPEVRATS